MKHRPQYVIKLLKQLFNKENEMAKSSNELTGIKVDGQIFVKKGEDDPKNSNIKIVILQRGWAMIGRWTQKDDVCTLENAYVIRTWGTSKGLGQLALEGEQSSTKLDKAGTVTFHILTTVAVIDCKEDLWTSKLV